MAKKKKTTKKKTQKKMGRPKKKINKVQVDNWIKLQATQEEIAAALGVCRHTITDRIKEWTGDSDATFLTYYGQKRKEGRIELRKYQRNLSKTSPAMAIFLGKQYLGQKDVVTVENITDETLSEKSMAELMAELKQIKDAVQDDE